MNVLVLVLLAFSVIGFVDWLKGLIKAIKEKNRESAVYAIVNFVASMAIGFIGASIVIEQPLTLIIMPGIAVGFILNAFTQLCYTLIIQTVQKFISGLSGGADKIIDTAQDAVNKLAGK